MRCTNPARARRRPAGSRNSSRCRHDDDAGGRPAALRERPFLRRIRVRLGLGRRLPAQWPRLLPEAAVRDPVHAGDRAAPAGARRRGPRGPGRRAAARRSRRPTCRRPTCCSRRDEQAQRWREAGFMLRSGVQFHWINAGLPRFRRFPRHARAEKNARTSAPSGARCARPASRFAARARARDRRDADWRFFNRCYDHTYAEHFSTPYLNLRFLPPHRRRPCRSNLLLVIAERDGQPIAASLVVHRRGRRLYGRYWGALEHVPCLHFEAAYYQPLEFCIEQASSCFEGGAQGEHKMARGFLPRRPGRRTGWRIRRSRMRWSGSWSARRGDRRLHRRTQRAQSVPKMINASLTVASTPVSTRRSA